MFWRLSPSSGVDMMVPHLHIVFMSQSMLLAVPTHTAKRTVGEVWAEPDCQSSQSMLLAIGPVTSKMDCDDWLSDSALRSHSGP
jgi:hypothetical protein